MSDHSRHPARARQRATEAKLRARGYDVLLAPLLHFEAVPAAIGDEKFAGVIITSANALRARPHPRPRCAPCRCSPSATTPPRPRANSVSRRAFGAWRCRVAHRAGGEGGNVALALSRRRGCQRRSSRATGRKRHQGGRENGLPHGRRAWLPDDAKATRWPRAALTPCCTIRCNRRRRSSMPDRRPGSNRPRSHCRRSASRSGSRISCATPARRGLRWPRSPDEEALLKALGTILNIKP